MSLNLGLAYLQIGLLKEAFNTTKSVQIALQQLKELKGCGHTPPMDQASSLQRQLYTLQCMHIQENIENTYGNLVNIQQAAIIWMEWEEITERTMKHTCQLIDDLEQ